MAKNENWERLSAHWNKRRKQTHGDVLQQAGDAAHKARHWVNRHALWVGGAAAVLALGAWIAIAMTFFGGGARPADATAQTIRPVYFLDLGNGQLYVDRSDRPVPGMAPSGKESVRAYAFSCGACNEQERFVGWIEKHAGDVDPEATAVAAWKPGVKPEELQWVSSKSPEGERVLRDAQGRCAGREPQVCLP